VKILVVGQGIAGTMLAWSLRRQGAQAYLADAILPGSASAVAAGIINPVTGKRFVKSWRFDTFFPAAQNAYQALEAELGVSFWQEALIVRLLATPAEANDWSARCALPDYAHYLSELPNGGQWSPFLKPGFRFGAIRHAARVHFPILINAFREKARMEQFLLEKSIDYQDIARLKRDFDYLVFCEGYRAVDNPFFPNLPWQTAKGEALRIRFQPRFDANGIAEMLKKTMTLVPLGDGTFWAGGSYQWHFPDLLPSAGERDFILQHLQSMLAVPFETIGHTAGIRPTVKDRRPLIGQSPVDSNVFIFNGLGTKAALLAPYWAEHLAAHFLNGKRLDSEVDIQARKEGQA
jgi:glycine/D-amino acid oxidase-like deaminating enzyme